MHLIISPAKKMNQAPDILPARGLPVCLEQTGQILQWLQRLSWTQLKQLWGCNDALTDLNEARLRKMTLNINVTPAIISYEGIQYRYMAPQVMETPQLEYLQAHLRILSGFYGILKPFDGVTPYRLEMQARADVDGTGNLYAFWGDRLYRELVQDGDHTILNLASEEYAKIIRPYLQPEDRFITCVFGEMQEGRIVQKGTMAKMARGEMVRFLAQVQAQRPEDVRLFDRLGYRYHAGLSGPDREVFLYQNTAYTT